MKHSRPTDDDLLCEAMNRKVLDFDSEAVCSVTVSNTNIYACLACGKFYQGIPDAYIIVDEMLTLSKGAVARVRPTCIRWRRTTHFTSIFAVWKRLGCLKTLNLNIQAWMTLKYANHILHFALVS